MHGMESTSARSLYLFGSILELRPFVKMIVLHCDWVLKVLVDLPEARPLCE